LGESQGKKWAKKELGKEIVGQGNKRPNVNQG